MRHFNFLKVILLFFIPALLAPFILPAQDEGPALTHWRSFLPYNQVLDFAYHDQTFYCATASAFFTYNKSDGMLEAYSKVRGMNDIGMSHVAFDKKNKLAVLTYTNSNIDLFKNNRFYNIPDLKLSQVNGDKTIHHIVADDGIAYLSTGIGLVLLNLERREVKETVRFFRDSITAPAYASTIIGDTIYTATNIGLYRSSLHNNFLTNYITWDRISDQPFKYLTSSNGLLFAGYADSIFQLDNESLVFFAKTEMPLTHLDPDVKGIWVSTFTDPKGSGLLFSFNGEVIDSVPCQTPSRIMALEDGSVWYGDKSRLAFPEEQGLRKRTSPTTSEPYFPAGPPVASSFEVSAYNGELWVAHGSVTNWMHTHNRGMFSQYKEGNWHNRYWISENEWYQDFIRIIKDQKTGNVYAGSFAGGLVIVNPDNMLDLYGDGYLPDMIGNPGLHNVSGLALDDDGNLWISNYAGSHELTVMTPDRKFYNGLSIDNNRGNIAHSAADVIIDDYNQKWFIAPANGGVIVYDDNGTVTNPTDDKYRILRSGPDNGNLPDNNTMCIAKDRDGAIWIGTNDGIAIVHCPGDVIGGNCEASLKVVRLWEDYLFARQAVRAIAVDAANRKWIGTNNGVWLISPDGEEVIYQFNAENSPLPSNVIERINIDPIKGDVYFSTEKGIVSFRSTAIEPRRSGEYTLFVYPNPVPPDFEGLIAVKDIPAGADVRITDVSGQLVYRTTGLGGQAVWNGKDYTGRRAQSGVYLVFVMNKDGSEKMTGKFIIQR